MRFRWRIFSTFLIALLVPAFSQVLSARELLRCADGRECKLPITQPKCAERSSRCHQKSTPAPIDPSRRCIWTIVPGLDLNHSIPRLLVEPPTLLPIADRDLLAALVAHQPQHFGGAIDRVPIARSMPLAPGEGIGPRSPPESLYPNAIV